MTSLNRPSILDIVIPQSEWTHCSIVIPQSEWIECNQLAQATL